MEKLFFEEQNEEEEGLDLSRYIQVVKKRKWLILAIFVVITVPWVLYLKSLPPTYEAFCDIEFRSLEDREQNVINESRIIKLRSRTFAEQVVAQLGLTLHMMTENSAVDRHQLFDEFRTDMDVNEGKFVFRWNNSGRYTIHEVDPKSERERLIHEGLIVDAQTKLQETKAGFKFKLTEDISFLPEDVKFEIERFKYAVDDFREKTNVSFAGSNILRLTMTDSDPVLVARMVNQLAAIFVEESKSIKDRIVDEQRRLIEEKLKIAEQNLQESEQKLKDFRSTLQLLIK